MSDTRAPNDRVTPAHYHRKIVTVERLTQIVESLRDPRCPGRRVKSVVQCHGCFDIVHPGHIRYLQFARTRGDVLIVSITGDAAIDKGEMRPYIPQELRAENLAALEFVDYVVIDPHPTAQWLLGVVRPDVYVKGQEYAASDDPRFLAERAVVESHGGRVIFSSGQVVFSSTRLLETLSGSLDLDQQRLSAVCRRHNINRRRLSHLIQEMRGRRVLVIGDSTVERYVLCDATEIAQEAPMMSLTELDTEDYLGGAAVIALQAAALGAEAVLVTGLGSDELSAWAEQTLRSLGVEVLGVAHHSDLPLNTRFLVDDRKILKTHRGAARPLDSLAERKAAELIGGLIRRSDGVIVYDCGYGLITPGLAHTLSRRDASPRAVLSASGQQPGGDLAAVKSADLICCSERRLRSACGEPRVGLSTLAYDFMQKTQVHQMMVTLGKRGLVTFDRRSHDPAVPDWHDRLLSEYLPSLAQQAVERLGVGEAVLTIATLARLAGGHLMQAAYLGSALAAMRLGGVGPVPATADEILRWIGARRELFDPTGATTTRAPIADKRSAHETQTV
jgi:rfaE bifunctional protein nucleotidyltransferase chain/domain